MDTFDSSSFHLLIDSDSSTPEIEVFPDFWEVLSSTIILPEFFLNSSSGLYAGIGTTAEWTTYLQSAFGCGKYSFDYFDRENEVIVLKSSPYWFGIGAIDGTIQDLDIETINIITL